MRRTYIIKWDKRGERYIGRCKSFPSLVGRGATIDEARRNIETAVHNHIYGEGDDHGGGPVPETIAPVEKVQGQPDETGG